MLKSHKALKDTLLTYVDASISGKMYANFKVQGTFDGEPLSEVVSLGEVDILSALEKPSGAYALSSYEFLLVVKKIKDSLDSEFSKELLVPRAIQQHEKKNWEMDKLLLMAELIPAKPERNKKCITYNNKGQLIVHKM